MAAADSPAVRRYDGVSQGEQSVVSGGGASGGTPSFPVQLNRKTTKKNGSVFGVSVCVA